MSREAATRLPTCAARFAGLLAAAAWTAQSGAQPAVPPDAPRNSSEDIPLDEPQTLIDAARDVDDRASPESAHGAR